MLSDPLYLGIPTTANPDVSPNEVNYPNLEFHTLSVGDKVSKRRAINVNAFSGTPLDQVNLTLSHSETKENAPFVTSRELRRLDVSRVDPETGKSVTLSVYQVTANPNSPLFTDDDVLLMQRMLAAFVLYGRTAAGINAVWDSEDDTAVRLLNGEA